MAATETGTYRVYGSDRAAGGLVFVERDGGDPVEVRTGGYPVPLGSTVDALRPGYLVEATLDWGESPAAITDLEIRSRTLLAVADGVPDIFEKAEDTFREARMEGMPVFSTVTYDTDGDPNGALYTVAKQPGERDLFAEFRDGRSTLEPMIDKLSEGGAEPPYEIFLIRPEPTPFFVVYLAIEKDGLLANTLRDEYGPPRP